MPPALRPTMKVQSKDMGFDALTKLMANMMRKPPVVAVGVTGEPAVALHKDADTGETVVEIARKHEYGLGNVPERSFIRATFDIHRERYAEATRKAFAAVVRHAVATKDGSWTPETNTSLKRLGLLVEGDIKKRIAQGIPPPLAPSTLRSKGPGKTTPLINTGQLRASILSVIYDKRPPP